MKRYPAYDPPEYVQWSSDPALIAAFDATLRRAPDRAAAVDGCDETFLLRLYEGLLRTRLHDITLKRWVRTGVISKAWLATGEEAATVGPVHALDRDRDLVAPMIRNAGACMEMGEPLAASLRSYLGTADSSSRGRDGHHGDLRYRSLQPISHVGDMVPVVAGIALAMKREGTAAPPHGRTGEEGTAAPPHGRTGEGLNLAVAMTWIGDGSTKAGVSHEGFNFAAVQRVPAIFVVQNNQVALGTRVEQHSAGDFADLPAAYGMAGAVFDGNNVLDAWAAAHLAVARCRSGEGPVMLIAQTFRMGGHATHDEREARATFPPEWFAEWGRRDPIGMYEGWLATRGVGADTLADIEARVLAEIDAAEREALDSRDRAAPDPASALDGVYAD